MKSLVFVVSFFLLAFFSCSENTTGPSGGTGMLKIHMTDSPANYEEVNIVVERVEVHKADEGENGWIVVNNESAIYDLLELRNGASVVIGETFLDAGHYTQVRLILGEGSNIVMDGVSYPLVVPSGMQTGVKLIHEFTIEPGITYELLLDFEAESSVVVTGNNIFQLKPTIRVMPVALTGSISGTIQPADSEASIIIDSEVNTFTDENGYFKFYVKEKSDYKVHIKPSKLIYKDKIISDVSVNAGQNTDLGVIVLTP
jgi:hypothetical protein